MMKRRITLQLDVEVPAATAEAEVSNAINAALDEPPCEWGEWKVGAAEIVNVVKFRASECREQT